MRVGFDLQSKGYSWEARYHWCSSDRPFLAYWEATLTMFRKPKHSDRCRSPVPLENPDESERKGNYTSFVILSSDAHFSCDIPSYSVLDPPFPRRPSAGELGSAPPGGRASALPAAHTSTGRHTYICGTHIFKDGRKGLRARLPDHNGGANRPADHGKARDP